ncbi:hypothetical protein PMAYCL1PPCAC_04068, partial [Pristionchus mayeri]
VIMDERGGIDATNQDSTARLESPESGQSAIAAAAAQEEERGGQQLQAKAEEIAVTGESSDQVMMLFAQV